MFPFSEQLNKTEDPKTEGGNKPTKANVLVFKYSAVSESSGISPHPLPLGSLPGKNEF